LAIPTKFYGLVKILTKFIYTFEHILIDY